MITRATIIIITIIIIIIATTTIIMIIKNLIVIVIVIVIMIILIIIVLMTEVDNSVVIRIFKYFMRPLFEYASVVYSPHHIGLIDLIENVQRRFTKILYGMND